MLEIFLTKFVYIHIYVSLSVKCPVSVDVGGVAQTYEFCKISINLVFLLNRTEPNFWSGSGSVHQISVRVRVRFIKPWFRFGSVHQILVQVRFGSLKQRFGSGSVRFIKSQFRFRFGSVQSCDVIFYT